MAPINVLRGIEADASRVEPGRVDLLERAWFDKEGTVVRLSACVGGDFARVGRLRAAAA